MKVFHVHNTPLAGLAALGQTVMAEGAPSPVRLAEMRFLGMREHFLRAGRDAAGRDVYALWVKSDGLVLTRLIESYCEMYRIPKDQYTVRQVSPGADVRLRLVAFAYVLGLFGLARWFLVRLEGSGGSLALQLAGVDS